MTVLSWQPSDIDGKEGFTGVMAVIGDFQFNVSGPWDMLNPPEKWVLAITRVSDLDNRTGLPDAHKFLNRESAQEAAEAAAKHLRIMGLA